MNSEKVKYFLSMSDKMNEDVFIFSIFSSGKKRISVDPKKQYFFFIILFYNLKKIIKKIKKKLIIINQKVGDIGSPTHPHSHVLSIKTW